MYFVYLLQCCDNTVYTGITTNMARRFSEHKNKKGGHYTAAHLWNLSGERWNKLHTSDVCDFSLVFWFCAMIKPLLINQ